ncbi:MAG: nitronate monooxygenase [Microscillaceae bacterium]|nr:nitronate monooxygenase [Microscillaceae bacterium]
MTKQELLKQLKIPLVVAPMFIVSQLDLLLESCKNGVLGTITALNNRTSEGLEEWLIQIKQALKSFEESTGKKPAPFGMNLIVHQSNVRLEADVEIAIRQKVPIIITSLGAVPELVDKVHSYGGLVFHDVINTRHAQKAIDAGVDGIICVAAGAGGHGGLLNPMPFISEVREMFDGIVILAGAMSSGKDVATALQMGADLAYMGTRFINTNEAMASEAYKNMIIEGGTQDIVYTAAVSGVNGNYLRQSLEAAGITQELWESKSKMDFSKANDQEAKAWKNIWSAGQGVATIKDNLPASELIARLQKELKDALESQAKLIDRWF